MQNLWGVISNKLCLSGDEKILMHESVERPTHPYPGNAGHKREISAV